MAQILNTPAEAVRALAKAVGSHGGLVYVSAGAAEPLILHAPWRDAPDTARGLVFTGLFVPGVNRFDYGAIHPEASMRVFMLSPDWRAGFATGKSHFTPLHYSASHRALVTAGAAAGIFQVSRPDASGACSFGLTTDAPPDMFARVGWKLGIVNRAMPHISSAPSVPLSAFDAVLEVDAPLAELPSTTSTPTTAMIAEHAAAFVRNGDVVQAGIGRLPLQALAALRERRGLRIHSGFIGDAHLELIEAGAIADEADAIVTGSVLGSANLYRKIGAERRVLMANVEGTHAHQKLASTPNLVALNAAVEVDLLGQSNAETARGEQISGVGGLVDFVRGALASQGGRAVVMLQAEGKGGESRIVPRLSDGVVTVPRTEAPILVTEFGAADLRQLDVDARAQAIIRLAPPAAREALQVSWAKQRKQMLGY